MEWPEISPVLQVRIARQTDQLESIVKFYTEGLGLEIIGKFEDHQGYDGVMIGLPGVEYHLEFISHQDGSPGQAPTKENLLVLYLGDRNLVKSISSRLQRMGYKKVDPENPYWEQVSHTIEDPDGWRVVLAETSGFQNK